MGKYIAVEKNNPRDMERIREYAEACKAAGRPCIIIFKNQETADIACDNWTSATHGIMTPEKRKGLEKPLSLILNNYPKSTLHFNVSEGRDDTSENLTHLWYTFTNVPLEQADQLAEEVYNTLEAALQQPS